MGGPVVRIETRASTRASSRDRASGLRRVHFADRRPRRFPIAQRFSGAAGRLHASANASAPPRLPTIPTLFASGRGSSSRSGASQIKLMAGGGVSSSLRSARRDPIHRARTARRRRGRRKLGDLRRRCMPTRRARCGKRSRPACRCIDHGQLLDEPTVRLMAEKGVWWSLQPFLDDEDASPFAEGSTNRKKQLQMISGTDNAYRLGEAIQDQDGMGNGQPVRCAGHGAARRAARQDGPLVHTRRSR